MLLPSAVDEITSLNEKRDFEGLIEITTKAIASDPNNPDLRNTRGWARYSRDDLEGAREDFSKACQLDPANPYAHYGLGLVCLDERDAERAYQHFTTAAELDPADPDYLMAKIRAAYLADRYQDLYTDCEKALAIDPDNADAYYFRALALGDQGDLKSAIRDQTEVIRINPNFDRAWAWRGYALYAKGEWVASLGNFKKAFSLDSEKGAELVLYIWAARSRIGEKALAMQELERILEDQPFTGENQWIPMVGAYLAGRMTEEELADALGARELGLDKDVALRVRCFFAGTRNLLDGKGKTALSRFKRIVDEDLQSSELWAAREEIRRLEAMGY
jgi:tetratricopeptide (TPR) repeat protein